VVRLYNAPHPHFMRVTKQAQNARVFDLRFTSYGMLCTTCKL